MPRTRRNKIMKVKLTEAGKKVVAQMEIPEAIKEQWESIWHEGNLVLFMTYGMSLRKWKEAGTLDRELKPYRELMTHLESISIITYGDAFEPYIEGMNILYNNTWMPDWLYTIFAPWVHRRVLKEADYFKTNQVSGSLTAVIAKLMFKKRLIVRQGYPWLQTLEEKKAPLWKRMIADISEIIAYSAADSIIVTTERDKDRIVEKDTDIDKKIHIVSNYIDTDLFKPDPTLRIKNRILYVGRLEHEKNLLQLIQAVKRLDVELIIIGDGSIRRQLETFAKDSNIKNVTFLGRVSNETLPVEYNKAELYVQPSLYEGNPKTILEAMACGCFVIGTDVRGINELIKDGDTGFLSQPPSTSINSAITRAKYMIENYPKEVDAIRGKARDLMVDIYSLQSVILKELRILRQKKG